MKSLVPFAVLIFCLYTSTAFGQEELKLKEFKEDILVVRTFEVMAGTFWSSKLSISDGDGEIWSIQLKPTKPKNVDENLTTIVKILNLIKKQGYQLSQSNSGGANELGVFMTNYIFEKRKE